MSAHPAYNAAVELLDRNVAAGRGGKTAFTDAERSVTYGALQRETCRVANLLLSLALRREERVAMIMLDTVDFPAVFLGAIRAGVVPAPLNTLLNAEQYAYMLGDSRARVLFVSDALYPVVEPVLDGVQTLDEVIVCGGAGRPGRGTLAQLLA
jgi:4-hydroxybenzoate-CoA ligase